MIYLTHTRLMLESERTVHDRAVHGQGTPRHVCTQLLSNAPRYALWHARHGGSMRVVATRRSRDRQILKLRAICVAQVHRTAMVRYLRENRVSREDRDAMLREFYGVLDPERAALAEHREYLVAASSQLCALELLELTGDKHGWDLVRAYETAYGQYFSMFCDRARARANGTMYLLSALIPEARTIAESMREGLLCGELLPSRPIALSLARTG